MSMTEYDYHMSQNGKGYTPIVNITSLIPGLGLINCACNFHMDKIWMENKDNFNNDDQRNQVNDAFTRRRWQLLAGNMLITGILFAVLAITVANTDALKVGLAVSTILLSVGALSPLKYALDHKIDPALKEQHNEYAIPESNGINGEPNKKTRWQALFGK